MDLDVFTRWAGAAALILSIINVLWIIAGRATKPMSEKLTNYGNDLKGHDRRIQAVEGQLQHLPSKDAFHQLALTVAKLEGHLTRLDEAVGAVNQTVHSIDRYLREEK